MEGGRRWENEVEEGGECERMRLKRGIKKIHRQAKQKDFFFLMCLLLKTELPLRTSVMAETRERKESKKKERDINSVIYTPFCLGVHIA